MRAAVALSTALLVLAYPTIAVEGQILPYSCYWAWVGYVWRYVCYYGLYSQYYYYYYQSTNVGATVSVSGLPPEYSTTVRVDGSSVGTVAGGSSQTFRVKFGESHTFQVDQYVAGASGARYFAAENVWTVDNARSDDSHSFSYTVQYEVNVADPHGKSQSSWYSPGSKVNLQAPDAVDISPGKRDKFAGWDVDGTLYKENAVTIDVNGAKKVTAKYVTEVLLTVNSPYGNVVGGGWYPKDSTATITAEPAWSSAPGVMGLLGARHVFDRWTGDISMTSPIATTMMDRPKVANAVWREDYTYTYVLVVALAAIALLVLRLTGNLPSPSRPRARRRRRTQPREAEGPGELP